MTRGAGPLERRPRAPLPRRRLRRRRRTPGKRCQWSGARSERRAKRWAPCTGNVLMGCRSSRVTRVSVINLSLAPHAQSVRLRARLCSSSSSRATIGARLYWPEDDKSLLLPLRFPLHRNFLLVINDRAVEQGGMQRDPLSVY